MPVVAAVLAATMSFQAHAEGDLARKCEELDKLVLGTDEAGFKVSKSEYALETGKCYKLEIASSGKQEYAL